MERINQAGCRPREKRSKEMKKIINGKRYDTETAEMVADDSYSNYGDFEYWSEELYRTKRGNWCLCGEGGAMSRYSRSVGQNETGGGSAIIPLAEGEALAWLEAHTEDSEAYEEYFAGIVVEA